ncbi:MAG TPA: hypothetical protein VFJ94_05055 [Intrasporangium sp.]|uniref:ATP-grasp domain-containing protein n=1 Tax=Intrasporangium sp. TaxID=1925024 RepID=UPI002D78068D|nr:hypothetical protein [Intrasporangium sp.]HET7397871.1 hypothetical protein [Intrasporangium sp.]
MSRTGAAPSRHVELWVEARHGRPAVNPVVAELLAQVSATGTRVSVRVPELDLVGSRPGAPPDAVLLKTAGTLALSLAVAQEGAGVVFLNSAAATVAANDKAAVVARLRAAGLPVPTTYLVAPGQDPATPRPDPTPATSGDPADRAAATGRAAHWVTKPVLGWHGGGVQVQPGLDRALDAARTQPREPGWVVDDGTRLVQRRVGGDESDLKVYVAGSEAFAARKSFAPGSYASNDVAPVDLGPVETDIVLGAGEVLGLQVFGVDLRHDEGRPTVIDVNPFPGFRGFPAAVAALRSQLARACPGLA